MKSLNPFGNSQKQISGAVNYGAEGTTSVPTSNPLRSQGESFVEKQAANSSSNHSPIVDPPPAEEEQNEQDENTNAHRPSQDHPTGSPDEPSNNLVGDVNGAQSSAKPEVGESTRKWFGFSRAKKTILSTVKRGSIFQVKTEDLNPDDVIIAIMGPTGTGKSSFINTTTGNQTGVGHDLESCTDNIQILKFQCVERSYHDIIFVDTPGFDDTHKSDVEILNLIADWLKKTYERNVKLAGILYFHRISDNRMAGTPLKNLHMFEKLCGKNALQNIVLTTTMWDEVEEETGEQREKELQKHYWKAMINQGSKTMRYYNSEESAWSIVDSIVDSHNERYAVELQQELVDMKRDLPETKAGQELYGKLQALVARQQDTLQKIRASMKRHDDDAILTALKEEYEDLRKQLEATIHDMEVLKIPIGKRLRRFFSSRLGFLSLKKR